jgi:hypothetical protein
MQHNTKGLTKCTMHREEGGGRREERVVSGEGSVVRDFSLLPPSSSLCINA